METSTHDESIKNKKISNESSPCDNLYSKQSKVRLTSYEESIPETTVQANLVVSNKSKYFNKKKTKLNSSTSPIPAFRIMEKNMYALCRIMKVSLSILPNTYM